MMQSQMKCSMPCSKFVTINASILSKLATITHASSADADQPELQIHVKIAVVTLSGSPEVNVPQIVRVADPEGAEADPQYRAFCRDVQQVVPEVGASGQRRVASRRLDPGGEERHVDSNL